MMIFEIRVFDGGQPIQVAVQMKDVHRLKSYLKDAEIAIHKPPKLTVAELEKEARELQ